ncbi:hypothetical protein [Candidatus Villigracilis affinis]|nr:hypothetical protein [Anaerolineales bacterium]
MGGPTCARTRRKDIQSLNDNNLFFAWFNKGTSHVLLKQYVDAATA